MPPPPGMGMVPMGMVEHPYGMPPGVAAAPYGMPPPPGQPLAGVGPSEGDVPAAHEQPGQQYYAAPAQLTYAAGPSAASLEEIKVLPCFAECKLIARLTKMLEYMCVCLCVCMYVCV